MAKRITEGQLKSLIERLCDIMPSRQAFARAKEVATAPTAEKQQQLVKQLRALILAKSRKGEA